MTEKELAKRHGELAIKHLTGEETPKDAAELADIRSGLDVLDMRRMGPVLERLEKEAEFMRVYGDVLQAVVDAIGWEEEWPSKIGSTWAARRLS